MKLVRSLNSHFYNAPTSYVYAERLVEGVKLEVHGAVEAATIQSEKKVKAHLSENGVGKGRDKGFEFDKLKAVMMEL